MDKKILNEEDRELLILEMRERLNFYTFQASDEQFDAGRVEGLVKLIGELESPDDMAKQEIQADFEALKRYREEKSADAERLVELRKKAEGNLVAFCKKSTMPAGVEAAETQKESEGKSSRRFRHLPGFMGRSSSFARAAAAGIAVLLVVGSGIGIVNATWDDGYIHWIRKDDKRETYIVEPPEKYPSVESEPSQELKPARTFIYNSTEELPEDYQDYVVNMGELEGLKDCELVRVQLDSSEEKWHLGFCWQEPGQAEIWFTVEGIRDAIGLLDKDLTGYDSFCRKEIDGMEYAVCQKADNLGGTDVYVYFYYHGRCYSVAGKLPVEDMEGLAAGYAEMVLEKNENF